MNLACPNCRRTLEFSGDAPMFCGYCGKSLAGAVEVATAVFEPAAESLGNAATLPPDPTRAATRVPVDVPGREVAGYRLVRELGRGGMGVVWEAEQILSGRRVALKLLVSGRDHAPETLDRFVREGQLAAALSHPRSTFVYEAGAHDGQPYIAMELMPGRTLADISDDEGPLPVPRAVDLILDVIEGLEAAHATGVIHRDVKPSNCFLDGAGRVKVGDFGLSKSLMSDAHLTRTGAFMGTPLFAAPEQVRGGQVNERTDIYAVGATLFYLIAHRGPFTGDATAVIAQIASDPAPSLRSLCPTVPKDLDRVVTQTLEKDPARRVPTLSALRLALQPFASAGLVPAPLGRRLGAYFLDVLVAAMIGGIIAFIVFMIIAAMIAFNQGVVLTAAPPTWITAAVLMICAVNFAYFVVPEGRTGRSLGKRLLGLRVVRTDGSRPGLGRAALRTVFVQGLVWLTTAVMIPLLIPSPRSPRQPAVDPDQMLAQQLLSPLPSLAVLVCLVTMRPRNGYRGLHDLVSRTRVVMLRPAESGVRGLDPPVVKPYPVGDDDRRSYGPFQVRGAMGRCGDAAVYAARDETLKRRAWVFVRPRDAAQVPAGRTQIARATRPRWLQGGEAAGERWDAFEAVRGAPLPDLGAIAWSHGRFMLRDLAEELAAAVAESTLPAHLSLDQVWLDDDGRAKLLDAPLEETGPAESVLPVASDSPPAAAMDLFRETVDLCARGPALPAFVTEFLAQLKQRPNDLASLTWCAEQCRALATRPAAVRWSDRLVSIAISGGLEYPVYAMVTTTSMLALLRVPGLPPAVVLAIVWPMIFLLPFAVGFLSEGGLAFRLVGIAVRRANGRPSGRIRCGVRTALSWALPLLGGSLNILMLTLMARAIHRAGVAGGAAPFDPSTMLLSCGYLLLMMFQGVGMIFAIVFPQRGPQDVLAGTRLVPR